MKRFAPGHTEPFALADGEVFDAVVLAHNSPVRKHDFPLPRGQIGIQERPHRSVVVGQAKILAFRFFCGAQTVAGGFEPCVGFGQFPQGKNDAPQNLLGQVVEEIALVFAGIEAPQQLMAPLIAAMADPGVVAGGDAGQLALLQGPIKHRSEFHRSIALGAGQWRDPIAITIHQPLHDLLLERLPCVHHVMGNAELLTDAGCIHKPLGATGPFPAHQPERQAFHLPARLHQQCRRQGTVDASRETNGHAVLPGPLPQALKSSLSGAGCGGSNGHGRRREFSP